MAVFEADATSTRIFGEAVLAAADALLVDVDIAGPADPVFRAAAHIAGDTFAAVLAQWIAPGHGRRRRRLRRVTGTRPAAAVSSEQFHAGEDVFRTDVDEERPRAVLEEVRNAVLQAAVEVTVAVRAVAVVSAAHIVVHTAKVAAAVAESQKG